MFSAINTTYRQSFKKINQQTDMRFPREVKIFIDCQIN